VRIVLAGRQVEQRLQKMNGVKFAPVNLATESAYLISRRECYLRKQEKMLTVSQNI
jgi:hypothetical protein